ncbi:DUF1579 domain-containing protein [Pseudanabaena sp. FACHB-2040]|uniref:DUF1579 domain-containing protein n=1 Tax=Pseudanabaena sp. FACHB-2040 TaxID=2692859 RepID=UPI001685EBB2|nr:DUF1579 domain-containing protein [Pseudanabaena sp. FACHB-2040]MBD2259372.1 DUF1579 domain-containing protein [Pseudanabaena sp. FACHB-2040]
MDIKPQAEHQWLDKLIGQWISETECSMGPDQPPSKTHGTEVVHTLGGLWIVAEGEGEMPDGEVGKTLMTLGYDPQTKRYVGTFVASMMTHLWRYSGSLDQAEKTLTLETEGPNFSQSAMAQYKDIIEFVSDDHRIMTSQILTDDGHWHQFMTAHYRRQQ